MTACRVWSRRLARLGLFGLVLAMWFPGQCPAGGSFAAEDLQPLLAQEPAVAAWLAGSLELDDVGSATRIGQNVNARLGGTRVGPYVLRARPKGSQGPFSLEVTVETVLTFRNAAGKVVDLPRAHAVEERFAAVTVRALKE